MFLFCFSANGQVKRVKDLKPTVILISLDGFRSDYIDQYNPPALNKLAREGVRARWMIPSFPTKTFPNHYTIATGLYPDHHGIIENNIYDSGFDAEFHLNERDEVEKGRWWGGEPIWVTAEKQGQTAASFFFPGTESLIQGRRPTIWKAYDHQLPNEERVDAVLTWFDLPKEKRPTIITMYFSDTDDAGHGFSPDAPETRQAVLRVDANIARLYEGLKQRKIEKKVNLIIVSDHGMAPYDPKNAIILDEMFDPEMAERIFWVGEFVQIFPKKGREKEIYDSLKAKLPADAAIYRPSDFPARLHFGTNPRIAPIVVVPKEGFYLTNRKRFDEMKEEGRLEGMRGAHGYDNSLTSMRATFIAHGPAFKKHFIAEPFENIEIYNLMCRILKLKPAPNDGDLEKVRQMLR